MLLVKVIGINFILICLYSLYTIPVKAHSSIDFLNSTFNKIYTGLSFYKTVSYNLKITTSVASNIISTYTATVTEIYNNDANYVIYKLNNKQIFFSYSNILGIQRFWLGKPEDLPEVYSKDTDNKLLNTAISYNILNINPLWFNIPVNYKYDQGFLFIQTYSKNLFTSFPKVEIYLNKENIPIRILYYNKISNFPGLEVLVTNYRKEGNGYFIYKTEYKDNSSKKVTVIEKNDVRFDTSLPAWFEDVESLINNNITNYYNYFMMSIRDKDHISDFDENFNKFSCEQDNKIIEPQESIRNTFPKVNKPDSILGLPNVKENKKNFNNILLQELDSLNEDSLLFKESMLGNKNSIEGSNDKIGKNKVSPKIKDKRVESSKIEEKNTLQKKTNILNKSKNVKIVNKDQVNGLNKEKSLVTKKSINKKPVIKNNTNTNTKTNTNNIRKDKIIKKEDSLKLEKPTVKIVPENSEKFDNDSLKDMPLKKEKKKNTLNNLF